MGWGGANRPIVSTKIGIPVKEDGADGDIQIKGTGLGAKLFAKWSGRWWDVPLSIDGVTKIGVTDSDYLSIDRDSVDIYKDSKKVAEFGQDTVISGGTITIQGTTGTTGDDRLVIGSASLAMYANNAKVLDIIDSEINIGPAAVAGTAVVGNVRVSDSSVFIYGDHASTYAKVSSSGLEVFKNGVTNSVAKFSDTTVIGDVAQNNIQITSSTLKLRDATTDIIVLNNDGSATIKGTVTIGRTTVNSPLDDEDNASGNILIGNTNTGNELTPEKDKSIENVVIGTDAMKFAEYGRENVFIGFEAAMNFGDDAASGAAVYGNVAIGRRAYKCVDSSNIAGAYNVAIGFQSMEDCAGGSGNTCVGYRTGEELSGGYNTLIGYDAGYASGESTTKLTTGTNNVCISAGAGTVAAVTTDNNITYAVSIGTTVSAGVGSVAIGKMLTASGENSIAMGTGTDGASNRTIASGDNSIAIGTSTDATGAQSIAIGEASQATVADSVALGTECEVTGYAGSTAIGHNVVSSSSGAQSIGIGAGFTVSTDGRVQLGIGTSNSAYIDPSGSGTIHWTGASDRRLKKNIVRDGIGLDFINELHPSIFEYRAPSEMDEDFSEYNPDNHKRKSEGKDYGFIAQEVKKIVDKYDADYFRICSKFDNSDVQGLSVGSLVVPLTKAVQELSAKLDTMQTEINTLKQG